jgi:hypothetical protein
MYVGYGHGVAAQCGQWSTSNGGFNQAQCAMACHFGCDIKRGDV